MLNMTKLNFLLLLSLIGTEQGVNTKTTSKEKNISSPSKKIVINFTAENLNERLVEALQEKHPNLERKEIEKSANYVLTYVFTFFTSFSSFVSSIVLIISVAAGLPLFFDLNNRSVSNLAKSE